MPMLRLLVGGLRDLFRSQPSLEAELVTLRLKRVNERQIERVLDDYRRYDNRSRTHLLFKTDTPDGRAVALPLFDRIVSVPEVGGLHHRHERVVA